MSRTILRKVEQDITRRTITALISAGCTLAVNDGETTARPTTDAEALTGSLMDLDDGYLCVVAGPYAGAWVRFVYGNDGWDCINDYTVNLEAVLAPVNAYADTLSA